MNSKVDIKNTITLDDLAKERLSTSINKSILEIDVDISQSLFSINCSYLSKSSGFLFRIKSVLTIPILFLCFIILNQGYVIPDTLLDLIKVVLGSLRKMAP